VEAAAAGFDMIGFDASTMPLEANINRTPGIVIEGELGNIGSGSEIHDRVPESSRLLTRRAILVGTTIIHINTEIRFAWRRGLEAALAESPDEVVPYRIYASALKEMRIVAYDRLRLFNGA
jgi:fructose/tagatose bisphosphate aldolase